MKKDNGGRKSYLIDPQFQIKVIGYALFLALLTIGVFYLSQLYFFYKLFEVGKNLNFPSDHAFFQFLAEQKKFMQSVFIVTAIFCSLVLIIAGTLLSHRVAGPIYRLKTYLNDIVREEQFRELKFRKSDFFFDLAESLNRALALYQKRSPLPRSKEDESL